MIGQGLRPPSVEGVYLGLGEGGGEGGFDFVQHKYHISSSDPRDLLTIENEVRYLCQKLLSSGIVLGLDHQVSYCSSQWPCVDAE